jgi:hypothetical protein
VSTTRPIIDAFGSKTSAWVGFASHPGITGFEHVPVLGLHVPAVWHESSAVQVTAVPAHVPAPHASPVVQALPSLHAVPFAASGFEHVPLEGSHVPATWHWSLAVHVISAPPHTPASQVSPVVQALPSLHSVPLVAAGFEHVPLVGSQVPATWHSSSAEQVTGVPPQTPLAQLSPVVQALPSLHAVPLGAGMFVHTPEVGSQTPAT